MRPSCLDPVDGRYQHAVGAGGQVTPVLLLGHGARGVVVGAQANGSICQTLDVAHELVKHGYHVAIFDWTQPYAEAMATASRALLADGAKRNVVGGFSRGALVGLGVAPRLGASIVGVFSVSGGPSADEGFGTITSLSQYRGPILLIASQDDPVFPPGTSAAIAARHRGPDTLLIMPGRAHALSLLTDPDAARVWAALYDFLHRVLG